MLFQIDYKVFEGSRGDSLRAFGSFTQEQLESLLNDNDVNLIGRWHCLGDGTGTMIVETDDFSKCNQFQLAWAEVCDMSAKPVVTDVPAREAIQKHFMQ
ncbi:MAG: DUF3303 domain-containing protein [Acidimicrobiales bacterium]|nr:DUF3303 family protein [Acidimicrobiales bacterium]OUV41311.1 MAG: hypothetical protein CBC68_06405 [Candidatus Marinimicrobia bacterium TMED108]|tara:strand:+ start:662 stop:958 length:297 start_codon:yes stop_codon:yes gene_type:complete